MPAITEKDGVKTGTIHVFIDAQKGFHDYTLGEQDGGCLYVPQGEEVIDEMAKIIDSSRDGVFVLSQDYHPATHISYMENHPGILAYRKNLLERAGKSPDEVLNVLELPFSEIVLDKQGDIIGVKDHESGKVRAVKIQTSNGLAPTPGDRGRVSEVLDEIIADSVEEIPGASTQTLWRRHCQQGTESSLFDERLHLPQGLIEKLRGDLTSSTIYHRDPETGNEFHIVRKGTRSEVDSYGIGVENDKETETPAKEVFQRIAREFREKGVNQCEINVGGLASNFCVEFSANNIADFLAGHFKMRGQKVSVNYVPEISRGIPIPGGPEVPFSEPGVADRLRASRGIETRSLDDVLASLSPAVAISGDLTAQGPEHQRAVS